MVEMERHPCSPSASVCASQLRLDKTQGKERHRGTKGKATKMNIEHPTLNVEWKRLRNRRIN